MGQQKRQQVGATLVQVVESDTNDELVMVQPPCHHTNRPGAGAGGRNSQLEKIGNAIQTPARAPGKLKVRNVVVPLDEPENVMAPPVTKKKGRGKVAPQQLERNLSVIEASKSGLTAAGPTPALHIMDQGRFGLQDHPTPSAYPYVHDCGTSQGASRGASRGASQGASWGASCSISHGASLRDPQADGIRITAVQRPVGTHIVSHDIPQSVSDQRSSSSIPILNSAVQQEPSTTITPHHIISRTPPAFSSSTSQNIKIKQIVLTVIPMAYELVLSVNRNTIDSVKLKATGLLKKAMYLHGYPDSEGHASNFANNMIHIVCHKSFYDNGSKSLKQFPEFQKTIPPPALFLVGTIIHNVIYIYSKYGQVNGAKQTPIEDSETSYNCISTLFDCTNKDKYHGPKLCQMLKAWALEGMNTHGAGLGTNEGDDGCSEWDVDLD
ncbi:uncharacterized protein EDB91DRAFT_1244639 [Suillus paluster]|uniref:uncharacterized protein n=1 Tax=Suillus paluster TaxID=48578 RepID=UPI001B8852DF|nr:uncharacterized protein EDB91DRAFT_1244639 [Suillus paluster]KAG1748823.1 hypothetical protein EDB91DRAFT_1244639 [Suillus paluster]